MSNRGYHTHCAQGQANFLRYCMRVVASRVSPWGIDRLNLPAIAVGEANVLNSRFRPHSGHRRHCPMTESRRCNYETYRGIAATLPTYAANGGPGDVAQFGQVVPVAGSQIRREPCRVVSCFSSAATWPVADLLSDSCGRAAIVSACGFLPRTLRCQMRCRKTTG